MYYAHSAYFGGTPTPPNNYTPQQLASPPYGGGWLSHMDVIKWEDAWYWHTYSGDYAYQGYFWNDLPVTDPPIKLTFAGRWAQLNNFKVYAWNGSAWEYLGETGPGQNFYADVTEYNNNENMHILCYYGHWAWAEIDCSYVNVIAPWGIEP